MSSIMLSERASSPSTPSSSKGKIYIDNTSRPLLKSVDSLGSVTKFIDSGLVLTNCSTSTQGPGFTVETYIAGSSITIPTGRLISSGFMYKCRFDVTKDANAGGFAHVITVRVGSLGTTADTGAATLTFGTPTAVVDTGLFEVSIIFKTISTASLINSTANLSHNLEATGLTSLGTGGNQVVTVNGAGPTFNATLASLIIGLSYTAGGPFCTTNFVQSEVYNLNV